jgi:hypothetical protein
MVKEVESKDAFDALMTEAGAEGLVVIEIAASW